MYVSYLLAHKGITFYWKKRRNSYFFRITSILTGMSESKCKPVIKLHVLEGMDQPHSFPSDRFIFLAFSNS